MMTVRVHFVDGSRFVPHIDKRYEDVRDFAIGMEGASFYYFEDFAVPISTINFVKTVKIVKGNYE